MDRETQALWRRYRGSSAPEDRAALYRALVRASDQAGLCELGEHDPSEFWGPTPLIVGEGGGIQILPHRKCSACGDVFPMPWVRTPAAECARAGHAHLALMQGEDGARVYTGHGVALVCSRCNAVMGFGQADSGLTGTVRFEHVSDGLLMVNVRDATRPAVAPSTHRVPR